MKASILGVVAVGGAIGSMARYAVSTIQSPVVSFPYAIFIVNLSGGFLMGVVTTLLALKFSVSSEVRAFLTTGILGGYTTFSTFSLETMQLFEDGELQSAATNIAVSLLAGGLAAAAGIALAAL